VSSTLVTFLADKLHTTSVTGSWF